MCVKKSEKYAKKHKNCVINCHCKGFFFLQIFQAFLLFQHFLACYPETKLFVKRIIKTYNCCRYEVVHSKENTHKESNTLYIA
ncbi:hypothetical protein BpHYR1_007503 [Brachionus plicatilis]|uniref:Uncharacterized protein n=1 Tax=Brachionus plicatilis TaxID=10195 RepID=A0A3M7REX6_BRAPC|nr:hypothetical protein BpHYR1_007503 [Brachionus plicatilis]